MNGAPASHRTQFIVIGMRRGDEPLEKLPDPYWSRHIPRDTWTVYRYANPDGSPVTAEDVRATDLCPLCWPKDRPDVIDNTSGGG